MATNKNLLLGSSTRRVGAVFEVNGDPEIGVSAPLPTIAKAEILPLSRLAVKMKLLAESVASATGVPGVDTAVLPSAVGSPVFESSENANTPPLVVAYRFFPERGINTAETSAPAGAGVRVAFVFNVPS